MPRRLIQTILIVAVCLAGVIGLQVYLSKKADIAKYAPSNEP